MASLHASPETIYDNASDTSPPSLSCSGVNVHIQPFPLFDFPYDILMHVLDLVQDRATLSRLSRTCKIMHDTVLPVLLISPGDITTDTIESFHSLLHIGHASSRAHLVKEFTYGIKRRPVLRMTHKQAAHLVADILMHTPYLVSLTLHGADKIYQQCSSMHAALASLTHLRVASFSNVLSTKDPPLLAACAPLRALSLNIFYGYGYSTFALLRHHAPTLEDLKLYGVSIITPKNNTFLDGWDPAHTFPALRRLSLAYFTIHKGIPALFHLFPHLTHLSLRHLNSYHYHHPQPAAYATSGSPYWRSLQRLSISSTHTVHALGLACPVRRLDVGSIIVKGIVDADADMVRAMLDNTRPRCLAFGAVREFVHSQSLAFDVKDPAPLLTQLRHAPYIIHLILWFRVCETVLMPEILPEIARQLRDTSVSHVLVRVKKGHFETETSDDVDKDVKVEDEDEDDGEGGVRSLVRAQEAYTQVLASVRSLTDADLPQLRCVLVLFVPFGLTGWERNRDGGGWRALSEYEARQIRAEEMEDQDNDSHWK